MKIDLETLSKLERKLNIEVPLEKVTETLSKVYKSLQNQVTVKGFRKGKAPLTTIKSMYRDRVESDVIQELVNTFYYQALDQNSLQPLGQPQIKFDKFSEEEPFKFSAQFEIRPDIKIQQFENLPVERERLEIKEEQITQVLDRMQKSRASEGPMIEVRPAQLGDLATIDFAGFVDGKPLDNSSGSEQTMELGQSGFIPGFDDWVVGMNVGETRDVDLTFPENYGHGLANTPVKFKITLKRLGKKTLPELNDEFAKSLGAYGSLQELKDAIKKDITESEEVRVKKDLKSRILKALVQRNPVDVPAQLLKDQKRMLVHDLHQKMEQQGMKHDQFEEYAKKWDGDFENSAKFIIQSSFLISALADQHQLRASEQDVKKRLEEYSVETGIELGRIQEYYGENDRKASLAFQITEEKVVDLLISKAAIREVPKSEIKETVEHD